MTSPEAALVERHLDQQRVLNEHLAAEFGGPSAFTGVDGFASATQHRVAATKGST
ncbi:hypothetical protein ACFWBG_30525 [Nocardia salmonicida]|uniref:hypothetical protein n=1 Tax=Nocardia salmonicida TaxID=53431 RepID=UPI00366CDD19